MPLDYLLPSLVILWNLSIRIVPAVKDVVSCGFKVQVYYPSHLQTVLIFIIASYHLDLQHCILLPEDVMLMLYRCGYLCELKISSLHHRFCVNIELLQKCVFVLVLGRMDLDQNV